MMRNLTWVPILIYLYGYEGYDMKRIQTVVAMKIKGRLLELTAFIDDIEDTNKKINFEVDRNLYRKFQAIVGKGNVSEVIRKFMLAVVRKYERLSEPSYFLEGGKHGKQKRKEKG
jgi:hypothetical protein